MHQCINLDGRHLTGVLFKRSSVLVFQNSGVHLSFSSHDSINLSKLWLTSISLKMMNTVLVCNLYHIELLVVTLQLGYTLLYVEVERLVESC